MRWSHMLLSLEGRISRRAFWLKFVLPWLTALIAITILAPLPSPEIGGEIRDAVRPGSADLLFLLSPWSWIIVAFACISLWPAVAAGTKRCHDRNRSSWFLLIGLVPYVGVPWLILELGFLRGTSGPNRFGADPLGYGGLAARYRIEDH